MDRWTDSLTDGRMEEKIMLLWHTHTTRGSYVAGLIKFLQAVKEEIA